MAKGIALFVIWIAGIDLGVCLGNDAAGGVFLPQAWFGAFILNLMAVIAVGVATVGIKRP